MATRIVFVGASGKDEMAVFVSAEPDDVWQTMLEPTGAVQFTDLTTHGPVFVNPNNIAYWSHWQTEI
jgi:hypothetical protein